MADLTIATRPGASGLAWVRTGMRLLARSPWMLILLVALGPMVLWVLGMVPVIGTAFALILVPAASIGMLNVCRAVDLGEIPSWENYVSALREPASRLALIKIGIYHAVVVGTLSTLWAYVDPDTPQTPPPAVAQHAPAAPAAEQAPAATNNAPAAAASDSGEFTLRPATLALFLASVAVLVPLQMTIWFAPALVSWHGMPAMKALFFSFFACWRNRAPMFVYLLALMGIAFVAILAFAALVGALHASEELARYILAPLPLALLAINQTCLLAMVHDIIQVSGDDIPDTEPTRPAA